MGFAWNAELLATIKAQALAAGFELAGVAGAPAATHPSGTTTARQFDQWVALGRAGEMDYLTRCDAAGEFLRRSARIALPWARSVVVCAFNYNLGGTGSLAPSDPAHAWIGRYAWLGKADGQPTDYHDELLQRLRLVESALRAAAPCQTRCYVDTGPLLERDFAARAGVGWIGKNTCVLNQQQGSWLLLAVIVTDLELEDQPHQLAVVAADRCGTCTRCIDACPTGALVGDRQMDASLCIAYLTIEKKGDIPRPLRQHIGRQVFGCDICQDVCPWNRNAPISVKPGLQVRQELINPDLAWLGSLDGPGFRAAFKGSPLERTKRKRLLRNVAIAMGNSGRQSFIPRLEQWAAADDPILAETATWALARLRNPPALVE